MINLKVKLMIFKITNKFKFVYYSYITKTINIKLNRTYN